MLHVAVKRSVPAEPGKEQRQHGYAGRHPSPRSPSVWQAPPSEGQERTCTPRHHPPAAQEHRQADQHEKDGPHQRQRAEPPQVAHGLRIQQHQAEEGADRRDVPRQQGRHHLAERLAHVPLVFQVLQEVQGIVDRNADDDRADADNYQRQPVPQHGHRPQGKEPAGQHGHAYPHQVAHPAEGIEQHGQDKHHGQADGQQAVPLDLRGIGDGYQRRTDGRHPYLRADDLHVGHARVQQFLQAGVIPRLADAERRLQQGDTHAIAKEVAVHHLVRITYIQPPETSQQGRCQLQGVIGQSLRQDGSRGQHQ